MEWYLAYCVTSLQGIGKLQADVQILQNKCEFYLYFMLVIFIIDFSFFCNYADNRSIQIVVPESCNLLALIHNMHFMTK